MSIDTHSYPIPHQALDQKSQRTSLQRGGFASMMDVLTQNESMNQTDNDAFEIPHQDNVIAPVEKLSGTPEPTEQKENIVVPEKSEVSL